LILFAGLQAEIFLSLQDLYIARIGMSNYNEYAAIKSSKDISNYSIGSISKLFLKSH